MNIQYRAEFLPNLGKNSGIIPSVPTVSVLKLIVELLRRKKSSQCIKDHQELGECTALEKYITFDQKHHHATEGVDLEIIRDAG